MRPRAWLWPLAFVGAVQFLTIAGSCYVSDHYEILSSARRLLDHHTLTLWSPPPTYSRYPPLTALTEVPLLALDESLGWADPAKFGRLVHLHGAIFVLASLALVASAVRRQGGSPTAVAMAVIVGGLAWPMWLLSRRTGPEPVLAFLVAVFVVAGSGDGERRPPSARVRQALSCLALPWVHAVGVVISAALAASSLRGIWAPERRTRAAWLEDAVPLAASAFGVVSFLLVWNLWHHGNLWMGHYVAMAATGDPFFKMPASPLAELWVYSSGFFMQAPVLCVMAWLAWRRAGSHVYGLGPAIMLTAALLLFFSFLQTPEPARRLAPACPVWAMVIGCAWDRMRIRSPWPQLLTAAVLPIGFLCLTNLEALVAYRMPDGSLHLPSHYYLWARLAQDGAPLWQTALPAALLATLAGLAISRVWSVFRAEAGATEE